jgi:hypothetical protein
MTLSRIRKILTKNFMPKKSKGFEWTGTKKPVDQGKITGYLVIPMDPKEPSRFIPSRRRPKIVDEEERSLSELNNLDREEMTEDFSDSPFLKNL